MIRLGALGAILAILAGVAFSGGHAGETGIDREPALSGAATGFYYAMRGQPDFGVGVASVNRGPLRVEAARGAALRLVEARAKGRDPLRAEFGTSLAEVTRRTFVDDAIRGEGAIIEPRPESLAPGSFQS